MKSRFINQLLAAPFGRRDGRTTWQLAAPLEFYYAPVRERLTVPAGYVTDFASIPRLPLLWWLMSDYGQPAAVVHDYLCDRKQYPRKFADEVFRAALHACGVSPWRAAVMFAAVRSYATLKGL